MSLYTLIIGSKIRKKIETKINIKSKKFKFFTEIIISPILSFTSLIALSFKLKKTPKAKPRDIIITCSKGNSQIKSVKNEIKNINNLFISKQKFLPILINATAIIGIATLAKPLRNFTASFIPFVLV